MTKIRVPKGMLEAALPYCDNQMHSALEAALQWLSENPIDPPDSLIADAVLNSRDYRWVVDQWQRHMFLAASPVIPEEIKDLLGQDFATSEHADEAIIEAYRRGWSSRKIKLNFSPGGSICYTKDSETGIPNSR